MVASRSAIVPRAPIGRRPELSPPPPSVSHGPHGRTRLFRHRLRPDTAFTSTARELYARTRIRVWFTGSPVPRPSSRTARGHPFPVRHSRCTFQNHKRFSRGPGVKRSFDSARLGIGDPWRTGISTRSVVEEKRENCKLYLHGTFFS